MNSNRETPSAVTVGSIATPPGPSARPSNANSALSAWTTFPNASRMKTSKTPGSPALHALAIAVASYSVIVATGSPGSISIRISLDSGRSSSADCTSSVILHVPDTVGVNRTSYSPSPLSVTTHGSPKSALGCPIGGETYAVSSAPP